MWNDEDMNVYSAQLNQQETAVLEAVIGLGFRDFDSVRVYANLKLPFDIDQDYLFSIYNKIMNPEGKVALDVE